MLESDVARLAEALSVLSKNDARMRDALGALGSLLVQITKEPARPPREREAQDAPSTVPSAETWDMGDGAGETPADERTVSMELISKRSRLKAESCRWAAERRTIIDADGDAESKIAPRDAELIERARSYENCFVWALHPYADLPDDHQLEVIAGCYECLAVAAETMMEIDRLTGNREIQQESMQLVAAAQSALRKALFDGGRRQRDPDQEDAFHWLKDQTGRRRIYVARHMRLMDPADPETWDSRIEAARQLVEQLEAENEQGGEAQRHLNRIRYHAARIDAGDGGVQDWERLDDAVRTLLEQHDMSPSDAALLESLELAVDLMPDDFEPGTPLRIALRETEEWLDSFEEEEEGDDEESEPAVSVESRERLHSDTE